MTDGISNIASNLGVYAVAKSLNVMKLEGAAVLKLIQSAEAAQLQVNNSQEALTQGVVDLYA